MNGLASKVVPRSDHDTWSLTESSLKKNAPKMFFPHVFLLASVKKTIIAAVASLYRGGPHSRPTNNTAHTPGTCRARASGPPLAVSESQPWRCNHFVFPSYLYLAAKAVCCPRKQANCLRSYTCVSVSVRRARVAHARNGKRLEPAGAASSCTRSSGGASLLPLAPHDVSAAGQQPNAWSP